MRSAFPAPLLAVTLLPSAVLALEFPVERRLHEGPLSPPSATATCEIRYFDDCNYFWLLLPLEEAGQTFGVVFESCAPNAELDGVWVWQFEGVPAGWGYTGYISVYEAGADDSPVEPPLARQPYVQGDQWTYWPFSVGVPDRFVVTIEYLGGGWGGVSPTTDYPPSSPCIPYRPVTHSYYYGTVDNPLRPGSAFFTEADGAFELTWQASLSAPTDIPRDSWASIKGLYR